MRSRRRAARGKAAGILCVLLGLVVAAAGMGDAPQRPRRGGRFSAEVRMASEGGFDGAFRFCRVWFQSNPLGDGGGWAVDYPRADINVSIRLSELTTAPITRDSAGEPGNVVVRLTDAELFQCPFIMMTEVGRARFDDLESARLREYLEKGGFLWADDFWGSYAWKIWATEIGRVLPPDEFPIVDLPLDHPIFHTLFEVKSVPQIPSINFWAYSGGGTSERGADSAEPHVRGIMDREGRLVVLITHNTDFGDAWEREAEDPRYFYRFSVDGYAFGIDVLMYALTH